MSTDERTCDEVRGELAALLYEEEVEARGALERHLASCDACRAELEEMRAAHALLSRWEAPEATEDPAALAAEVAGRALRRRRRWRLVAPRLAGAAAAVLLVSLVAAGTRVEIGRGRIAITVGLPWTEAGAGASQGSPDWSRWEERTRAIAADQVAAVSADLAADLAADLTADQARRFVRWSNDQNVERVRLVHAIDRARASDQQLFASLLGAVGRETAQQNLATRGALIDLAAAVAERTPEHRTERR